LGSLIPNVVLDDPATGHVTRRMRIADFAFKMAIHIAFSHNSATDQDRNKTVGGRWICTQIQRHKFIRGIVYGHVIEFRNFWTPYNF